MELIKSPEEQVKNGTGPDYYWTSDYGFNVDPSMAACDESKAWDELDEAWIAEIKDRFNQGMAI